MVSKPVPRLARTPSTQPPSAGVLPIPPWPTGENTSPCNLDQQDHLLCDHHPWEYFLHNHDWREHLPHGHSGPWWFKMLPRHTLYLDVWRWRLVGPDMCLFSLQISNTKCIGPKLARKWVVPNWRIFSPRCRGLFCTRVCFPSVDGSVCIVPEKLTPVHNGPRQRGEKKQKSEMRSPIFANFAYFPSF